MNLKSKTKLVIVSLALQMLMSLYYLMVNVGAIAYQPSLSAVFGVLAIVANGALLLFFLAILEKQKD